MKDRFKSSYNCLEDEPLDFDILLLLILNTLAYIVFKTVKYDFPILGSPRFRGLASLGIDKPSRQP